MVVVWVGRFDLNGFIRIYFSYVCLRSLVWQSGRLVIEPLSLRKKGARPPKKPFWRVIDERSAGRGFKSLRGLTFFIRSYRID